MSNKDNEFKSKFAIGESVIFTPAKEVKAEAFIRAVLFTNSKVRYSIYLKEMKSTIHNVDSILIQESKSKDVEYFGGDNYS